MIANKTPITVISEVRKLRLIHVIPEVSHYFTKPSILLP